VDNQVQINYCSSCFKKGVLQFRLSINLMSLPFMHAETSCIMDTESWVGCSIYQKTLFKNRFWVPKNAHKVLPRIVIVYNKYVHIIYEVYKHLYEVDIEMFFFFKKKKKESLKGMSSFKTVHRTKAMNCLHSKVSLY
jgi:hypothetical protein